MVDAGCGVGEPTLSSDHGTTRVGHPDHAVERRCAMVRENGARCGGTPALGETFCHAHRRYRETMNGLVMTIPLMEDQASITFIRSQTVRALAQGSIPPANGRAMLAGCRDAERRLDRPLEVQKVALRYAALAEKVGVEKARALLAEFVEMQETVSSEQRSVNREQRSVSSEPQVASGQQLGKTGIGEQGSGIGEETGSQETGVSELAPEPEAVMHRSVFPAVKGDWDRALERTEGKITEMVAPREGESWYDFLAKKKEREAAIAAAV